MTAAQWALVVMYLAVLAVYVPVPEAGHNTIQGLDYHQLHSRRIAFAQQALGGVPAGIPAWYPRELLGTPFRANIQNFPFIPTRLVLLALDPLIIFPVAVVVAALLAATFTYLYARRIGLGPVGAAAAGWTFAASGFFAARVMAGHLPLLEAYPALPLLMYLLEVCLSARPASATQDATTRGRASLPVSLMLLGIAAACVALAGHPQLPFYSFLVAGLYLLWRGRRRDRRRRMILAGLAMAAGAGCAAFSWWPMYLLIGRSTRLLDLEPSGNDVTFPYGRLGTFVLPWKDGWPPSVAPDANLFHGYPNDAYFWDTACYVGIAPLLAILGLIAFLLVRRRRPPAPWVFLTVAAMIALATALPAVRDLVSRLPGTILRSPARQVYITLLVMALAMGAAVDLLLRARAGARGRMIGAAVAVFLALHFADLGWHDRWFIKTIAVTRDRDPQFEGQVRRAVGDGRVALDYTLAAPFNREIDDVGFFDSIMLARPYSALLDLTGAPPRLNIQEAMGSDMSRRALASTGVRLVITTRPRPDLPLLSGDNLLHIYAVPNALPRAAFFAAESIVSLDVAEIHRRLRDPAYDLGRQVMVAREAAVPRGPGPASVSTQPASGPAESVDQRREGSDRIVVDVQAKTAGVLRVLESWDPGWRATVDGSPASTVLADDVYLAVPLGPGPHRVVLEYATPGAAAGLLASGVCAMLLLVVSVASGRRP